MVLVKSCQGPPTLTRNIIEAARMPMSHDIQIVFSDKKIRYSSALLVVMRYVKSQSKTRPGVDKVKPNVWFQSSL